MANPIVEILVRLKDEASEGIHSLGDSLFSLRDAVEGIVAGVIVEKMKQFVEMFAEEELAVGRLNAALSVTGRYSEEASRAIEASALRMQELTMHSREEALQISGTIATLAQQLTTGQIAQAQQVVIGIADAIGRPVEAVSIAVAKAIDGNVNGLKRLGIQISDTGTQQGNFNEILDKSNKFFEISKMLTETLGGQIAQAKNEFADLERTLGEVIVRFFGLDQKGHTLATTIRDLNLQIRSHAGEIIGFAHAVVDGVKLLLDVLMALVISWGGSIRIAADAVGTVIFGVLDAIKVAVVFFINKVIIGAVNDLLDKVDAFVSLFGQHLTTRVGEIKLGDAFSDAKAAMHDMQTTSETIATAWGNVAARVRQIAQDRETVFTLPPQGMGQTGGVPGGGTTAGEDMDRTFKNLKVQVEEANEQLKEGVITQDEYVQRVAAIRAQIRGLTSEYQLNDQQSLEAAKIINQINDSLEKMFKIVGNGRTLFPSLGALMKEHFLSTLDLAQQTNAELVKMADNFSNGLTKGIADAIFAHGNFGKAVEKAVGQAAAAQAKLALAEAIGDFGKALAAAALGDFGAAAQFTAAGEEMLLAGAAFAAIGGATGGFSGGGSKGGGGGGGGSNGVGGNSALAGMGGDITLVVNPGFTNDPAFIDSLTSVLEQSTGRRVTVQSQG